MRSKIYCVIVTYNGENWIRIALDSLRNSTVSVVPVVIDNASKDQTCSCVKEYGEAVLLVEEENRGFGWANNIGIDYALKNDADFVLLLNQDAAIEAKMIETMLLAWKEKLEFGILSPLQLTGDGEDVDSVILKNIFSSNSSLLSDVLLRKEKDIYTLARAPAAVWLIKRDVLLSVGGFDPVFFLYGEDDDYLNRLSNKGFRLGIVLEARALHAHSYKEFDNLDYKKKVHILYGFMVQRFKHPDLSITKRLNESLRCILRWTKNGLLKKDVRALQAIFPAVIRFMLSARKISRHREKCLQPGAWLSK